MSIQQPSFTLGVEEEYWLVCPDGELTVTAPEGMMGELVEALGSQVNPEFMQCQVEIGTKVCRSVREVADELRRLRSQVSEIIEKYDLRLMIASTHPMSSWQRLEHTNRERYNTLAQDLQMVARRLLICGQHVHVGIEDDDLRIDVMNQLSYFLPHLLALSTSSPLWECNTTGLKSYRLAVFDDLPRTGLPCVFSGYGEYRRTIDTLIEAGIIEDTTKVWWDLRPSHKFPTLEMRVTDVCTRVEDAVCIAAFYQCLVRMVYRLRTKNQRWRNYSDFLIYENRWRAQRYGVSEGLIDFGVGRIVPFAQLAEELVSLLYEDAEQLGCVSELEHIRTILMRGTSADWQIAQLEKELAAGKTRDEALQSVVDMLCGYSIEF